MKYESIIKAQFVSRPNRFIAHCKVNGADEIVHVKNTGRCKELLTPGAAVYLEKSNNPNRKTQYDLVGVEKGDILINMDSQAPNKAALEWLAAGKLIKAPTLVRPETKYNNSRFDFYIESKNEKAFVEVKGVTLENNKIAMFPDAPTTRGTKHINELICAKNEGYKAVILFVVQMKGCTVFKPNTATDPAFASALKKAQKAGIEILATDCIVTPDEMIIDKTVPTDI